MTSTARLHAGTPGSACRLVVGSVERAAHHDIRHAVFVTEQAVFTGSDVDDRDLRRSTLHVVGLVDGEPAGAVRLYPVDPIDPGGPWLGDRLAVLPRFRTSGLGAPLVRFAVATAAACGGRRMVAHVQPPNEVFFRRLGWTRRGDPEIYVGHPHIPMDIDLSVQVTRPGVLDSVR